MFWKTLYLVLYESKHAGSVNRPLSQMALETSHVQTAIQLVYSSLFP